MSFVINDELNYNDKLLDAFGRLKVSNPKKIFDATSEYGDLSGRYQTLTTGTGSVTFNSNDSSMLLNVGTASGDSCTRESTRYMKYTPGMALTVMMTGVLGSPKNNVVTRIGYYDDSDGYYFQMTSTGAAIVERSSSTGSVVETTYVYNNWTGVLNGTLPTIDFSKTQIFMLDLQWLGVGRVRLMLDIDGKIFVAHEINHANILAYTYIRTACLPIRYSISNTGTTASPSTMKQICSCVITDGSDVVDGVMFSADSGATKTIAQGAWTPVLSLRLSTLLNGAKYRGHFIINKTQIVNTVNSQTGAYKILLNPTLTNANFVNANASRSAMLYDISATAVSGGTVLTGGYVSINSVVELDFVDIPEASHTFYSKPTGANDTITIIAQGYTGTVGIGVTANWFEVQ